MNALPDELEPALLRNTRVSPELVAGSPATGNLVWAGGVVLPAILTVDPNSVSWDFTLERLT